MNTFGGNILKTKNFQANSTFAPIKRQESCPYQQFRLSRQKLLRDESEEFRSNFVCAMLFDTGARSSVAAPKAEFSIKFRCRRA